jgi:hypothetical protein
MIVFFSQRKVVECIQPDRFNAAHTLSGLLYLRIARNGSGKANLAQELGRGSFTTKRRLKSSSLSGRE